MGERYLTIRVKPRSHGNRIAVDAAGGIAVEVRSAPVEGAANAMVLRLLAEALGLPRTALSIRSGQSSKTKLIQIEGMDVTEAMARLQRCAAGDGSHKDVGA